MRHAEASEQLQQNRVEVTRNAQQSSQLETAKKKILSSGHTQCDCDVGTQIGNINSKIATKKA